MSNGKEYIPLNIDVDDEESDDAETEVHEMEYNGITPPCNNTVKISPKYQSPTNLARISETKEEEEYDEFDEYEEEDALIMEEVEEEFKTNDHLQKRQYLSLPSMSNLIKSKSTSTTPRETPRETQRETQRESPGSAPTAYGANNNHNSNGPKIKKQSSVSPVVAMFPSLHQAKMKQSRSKLKRYATVRANEPDLTEEECILLEEQIDILLDTDIQKLVLTELLDLYPKLHDAFAMVSGVENQAAFVCKMIRKGYIYVYNHQYDQIYNIFTRHPKYGIKKEYITSSFDIIIKNVLKHKSITNSFDSMLPNRSRLVWTKSNNLMCDLMSKAYKFDYDNKLKKTPSAKTLKKNRSRIGRSMTTEDIETVVSIWRRMIEDNKEKVGDLLAVKLQKQNELFIQFQRFNIDIFKQSTILINMLDKTINMLHKTDQLIPFLKRLGVRHLKMGIKPQLLALMKRVIMEMIKEVLAFNFNKDIKESWEKVMTFIVGVMMMEYSNKRARKGSEMSTTASSTITAGIDKKPSLINYDSNDIEYLSESLTKTVMINCQITWKHISQDSMIHNAVKIFYQDLMHSKQEIKDLFSASNMAEQSMRLVRAIGSTVALLDELDTLIPILQELGKRHVYYNVKPEHFRYVKKSWFKMLKKALALQWNKQIFNSWNIVWDFISFYMKTSLEDALLLYVPPEPAMVNFKVLINHIDKVKLQDLSFFADIWYAAYTGDNSSQSYAFGHSAIATANEGKLEGDGVLPFGGIRCLNSMQTSDKYRSLKEPYIRYFEEDDSWYLRGNIVGTFSQLFELQAYPFDVHNIEITFALEVDDTIAKFNADKISVRLMPFKLDCLAGTSFNVYEPDIVLTEMSAIQGGSSSGRRYTHCKILIPIARKYIHHVYNIIIPLMAIQLIAFAIYFTDLFPITSRLILSMTLFLTLFAFRRSISGSLPPTPYLTILDHAFNAACLLSVYHVGGLCAINQFQHLSPELLKWINMGIGLFALLIFLVIHIYLFVRARQFISKYPKKAEFKAGNEALRAIAKSLKNVHTS